MYVDAPYVAVLCKSAAVPAVVLFPALDAAFFPALWGACAGGGGMSAGAGGAGGGAGKGKKGGERGWRRRRRGLVLAWRAAAVGYVMLAAVALVGVAGAAYGNQSHRENVVPVHNAGEGLHAPQRAALAMRQVFETAGRTLAPDAWFWPPTTTPPPPPTTTTMSRWGRWVAAATADEGLLPRGLRRALSIRAKYPLPPAGFVHSHSRRIRLN